MQIKFRVMSALHYHSGLLIEFTNDFTISEYNESYELLDKCLIGFIDKAHDVNITYDVARKIKICLNE